MNYIELVDRNNIPQHIAIIMDGNGRWAQLRGKKRSEGHQAGVVTVRNIVEDCARMGVRYLTLYTFSTENWHRPAAEVAALMTLLFEQIEEEIFMKNNVGLRVIGDTSLLPQNVLERLEACIERTSGNDRMTLVLALSYSAKWEITEAVRTLARKAKAGEIALEDINEQAISQELTTNFMPDPDLLIRTGKEVRLSNFLLWQAAYSELYFTDVLWPEFDNMELHKAVYEYQHRQRRYGLTGEQVTNEENR
ncbi:MAG: isoprenyl transferase [Bacteroidaceae bacterium]|jgi:undecaprenyl diphosphate synthase|nr:isoprenyl transferase [Bacteroidaceae bacterium]